jgi:hypothetical protein
MSSSQEFNRIVALFTMFVILSVAVVSDLLIFLMSQQSRLSIQPLYFNMESNWVRSFATLITGAGFVFLAYFIYTRMSYAPLIGVIFLVLGLSLAFYPEVYLSGRLNLGLLSYLARYHGTQSVLYHDSGMICGVGLLTLLNRKPMAAEEANRFKSR